MARAEIGALADPTELYDCVAEERWAGMPNYLCPCCMHASLDREEILEHLRMWHIAPVMQEREANRAVGVGLYGANGQVITE
jgi:hypothetical protein